MVDYDPFLLGPFQVEARTMPLDDGVRGLRFACEVWRPIGAPEPLPLVVYSHYAGGHRRAATFLTGHLARHGYLVAAVDHGETFVPELQPRDGEDDAARTARIEGITAGRVPDLRLVVDELGGSAVGLIGHSLGGWSVLAAADADP